MDFKKFVEALTEDEKNRLIKALDVFEKPTSKNVLAIDWFTENKSKMSGRLRNRLEDAFSDLTKRGYMRISNNRFMSKDSTLYDLDNSIMYLYRIGKHSLQEYWELRDNPDHG